MKDIISTQFKARQDLDRLPRTEDINSYTVADWETDNPSKRLEDKSISKEDLLKYYDCLGI